MKTLSKQGERTFKKILERMNGDSHLKLGKDGDAFMPLSVERLGAYDKGTIYSLCHYFKQNGDLCQDPEMTFMHTTTGHTIPLTFQQAIPPVYQEAVFFEGGWKFRPRMQADLTRFANLWLKNIKDQQGL